MKTKAKRYKKLHEFSLLKKQKCNHLFSDCQNELLEIEKTLELLNSDYRTLLEDVYRIISDKDSYNHDAYENAKKYLAMLINRIKFEEHNKHLAEEGLNRAAENLRHAIVESNGYEVVMNKSLKEYFQSLEISHQKDLDEVARIQFLNKNRH